LAALLLVLAVAGPVAASGPQQASSSNTGRHCVNRLEHISPDSPEARIVSSICFDTFANAFRHMTRGRATVPDNLRPEQVTEQMLSLGPTSVVVLSTSWGCQNYIICGFGSTNWEASSTCTPSLSWALSYVGSTYDDDISSSKTYDGCHRGQHYEHPNYGGARLTCQPNCATMGVMNDETSSLSWDW
jgi:hypothetical protein